MVIAERGSASRISLDESFPEEVVDEGASSKASLPLSRADFFATDFPEDDVFFELGLWTRVLPGGGAGRSVDGGIIALGMASSASVESSDANHSLRTVTTSSAD